MQLFRTVNQPLLDDEENRLNLQLPEPNGNPEQYFNSPSDPLKQMGLTLDDILKMQKPEQMVPDAVPDLVGPPKSLMGAARVAGPKAMSSAPQMTTSAPQQSLEDDEMKKALASTRDNQKMLAMLQGASMIGSSIAGTKPVDITSGLQDLAKAPSQDVQMLRESLAKKMELDEQKQMHDPNSQSSKMQRDAMKNMLSKIGYKDLAAKINDNMSAKQVQGLLGNVNIQNLMTQYESMQNRLEMQRMKSEQLHDMAKQKMDDKDTKRFDQANKLIQSELARNNTAFGRNANIVRSAKAIETLVAGINPKDIDPRQVYEIASNLDAMLSSGASTVSGREHLVPQSFSKDKAKIEEYILGRPRGAGQEAFVKKLMETVAREKAQAAKQIESSSKKMLSSYSDLQGRHSELWNLMLQTNDLDPDMFKPKEVVPSTQKPVMDFTDLGFKEH